MDILLAIFGVWNKKYQSMTTHTLEGSRGHEKTLDQNEPRLADRWGRLAPPYAG
jgi:hypothetical protein